MSLQSTNKIPARGVTFEAILNMAIEHPLLDHKQIAALLGRNEVVVRTVMRSDVFLDLRAKGILERYGHQIENVRARVLEVADDVLLTIQARINDADADIPLPQLVEAAKFLMEYSITKVGGDKPAAPGSTNNFTFNIAPEDMQRSRALQARHANAITIDAGRPALPAPSSNRRDGN